MTKNIIKYTLIAVLAALSIALNYLKIPITTNVIVTVYAIPLLFAGCCFNFLGSLLVGLITGVVLQLISPYGITVTSPFWALAPIGWTLSSFFMNKLFIKLHPAIRSLIIVVVASLAATALNTFAMLTECWLINDAYYTYALIASELPARLLVMAIMIIPYSLLLFPLVDRVGPLYKRHFEKEKIQEADSENTSEIDN